MNICEKCIFESRKTGWCNEAGKEMWNLGNQFDECVHFIIKREFDPKCILEDFLCDLESMIGDLIKKYKEKIRKLETI